MPHGFFRHVRGQEDRKADEDSGQGRMRDKHRQIHPQKRWNPKDISELIERKFHFVFLDRTVRIWNDCVKDDNGQKREGGGYLVSISDKVLFGGLLILSVVWFLVCLGLTDPNHLQIFERELGNEVNDPSPICRQVGAMTGVIDCRYLEKTKTLWVKYLKTDLSSDDLNRKLESLIANSPAQ